MSCRRKGSSSSKAAASGDRTGLTVSFYTSCHRERAVACRFSKGAFAFDIAAVNRLVDRSAADAGFVGSLEGGRAVIEPAAVERALSVGVGKAREAVRGHAVRPSHFSGQLLGRQRRSRGRSRGGNRSRSRLVLRKRTNIDNQVPDLGVVSATHILRRHLVSLAAANGSEQIAVELAGKRIGVGPVVHREAHVVLAIARRAMAKRAIPAVEHLGLSLRFCRRLDDGVLSTRRGTLCRSRRSGLRIVACDRQAGDDHQGRREKEQRRFQHHTLLSRCQQKRASFC